MLRNSHFLPFVLFVLLVSNVFPQNSPSGIQSDKTDKQPLTIDASTGSSDDTVSLIFGRVFNVYDGDTISVQANDNKIFNIRLQGIDAPDTMQSFGKEARDSLANLVLGKSVVVLLDKKESFTRYIADVFIDGKNVSLLQLQVGMAWHFRKYADEQSSENRKKFAQAELEAKSSQLGLWKEKEPKAPWEYRAILDSNLNVPPNVEQQKTVEKEVKVNDKAKENDKNTSKTKAKKEKGIEYIIGPRGGCYYVNASGTKTYVKDKSLCEK
jgi:endonuclease YncB( thermonuclease family)